MSTSFTTSAPGLVVAQMKVHTVFETLSEREKLYVHYMARAAWLGARIILEQVSPEANAIFDFILEIHRTCMGNWLALADRLNIEHKQIVAFLDYAATFLSNVGNFYGRGDQKFVPEILHETLEKLASVSLKANYYKKEMGAAMMQKWPSSLGYPSESAQSQYYPNGSRMMTEVQILAVSKLMEQHKLWPENTRLQLGEDDGGVKIVDILQASAQSDDEIKVVANDVEIEPGTRYRIRLRRGDHSVALSEICKVLRHASEYANNEKQHDIIRNYIKSFETGDLEAFREAQRILVTDQSPRVESILGFIEPYRDPAGIRSEFEALVAIKDVDESRALQKLVEHSDNIIQRLPWTKGQMDNNGKGPFEKSLFDPPSFASIHTLVYCSSILFDGINLPNYNDLRQSHGFKNVVIANRLAVGSHYDAISTLVSEDVRDDLSRHTADIGYLWLVFHELFGHGTGKMMVEESEGSFNFDFNDPPQDPLTGKPINSWYRPGETWNGQFGDIATSVDECRCELVGAFLIGEQDLLRVLGHDEKLNLDPEEILYLFYVRLCALALLDLKNYMPESRKWGQAHSRAHFAMLRCLLRDGTDCVRVIHDPEQHHISVKVDRTLILTYGKRALEEMLLRLHMYRVTANVGACRPYYEALSAVESEHLAWRSTVIKQQIPRLIYVHANTFLEDGNVNLKEYEASPIGIIQSWVDRNI